MAQLISTGTGSSSWADFTVSTAPAGVFIKGADDGPAPTDCKFELAHKTSGGNYTTLVILDADNYLRLGGIGAPGAYGVRRLSATTAAGIDVEGADE